MKPREQMRSSYTSLPGAEADVIEWWLDESGPQSADLYELHMLAFAAHQLFRLNPGWVLDVGSSKAFLAVMSQFTRITSLDIRPWSHSITGLEVTYGDVLALPYGDGAIRTVMSLSVIEHIGTFRYDSKPDPLGSDRALRELDRILMPGGNLIISIPISYKRQVVLGAHRILTRDWLIDQLSAFSVVDEVALYPEPAPLERVATLGDWAYCMWVAWLRKGGGCE